MVVLGRPVRARRAVARGVDRWRPPAGRSRRRHHRPARDRWGAPSRGGARGGRDRRDARDRGVAGALRGGPRRAGAVGAHRPRPADRASARGRRPPGSPHRRRRPGRPSGREARRGRPGRRHRAWRSGGARRLRPDRGVPARDPGAGRGRGVRRGERGGAVRPRGDGDRGAQHVCRHRPSCRGRPSHRRPRSSASRTAMRCCSSRSRSASPGSRGSCPATPSGRWPCSSSRPRVRCSSPPRSRSSPGSAAVPGAGSS